MKNKLLALVLTACVVIPAGVALSSCGESPEPQVQSYEIKSDINQADFGDGYNVYLSSMFPSVYEGENYTFKIGVPSGLNATNMTVSINGNDVSLDLGKWTYSDNTEIDGEIDDCRERYWSYTIKKVKETQNILIDASQCTKAIVSISYGQIGDDVEFYTLKDGLSEENFDSTNQTVFDIDTLGDATYFDNIPKSPDKKVNVEHGRDVYVKVPTEIVEDYDLFVNSDERRQVYSYYERYNSIYTREYPYILDNGYVTKLSSYDLRTKNVTLEKDDIEDDINYVIYRDTFAFMNPEQVGINTSLLTEVEVINGGVYFEISQGRYEYIISRLQAEANANGYSYENYGEYIEEGGKYYARIRDDAYQAGLIEFDGKKYYSGNVRSFYGKAYGNKRDSYSGVTIYTGDHLNTEELDEVYTFSLPGKVILELSYGNYISDEAFMSDHFVVSIANEDRYLSKDEALNQPFIVTKRLVEEQNEYGTIARRIIEIDFDFTRQAELEEYFSTYSGKSFGKAFIHIFLDDEYMSEHYTEIKSNIGFTSYSSQNSLSIYNNDFGDVIEYVLQKGKMFISNYFANEYQGARAEALKPLSDESILNQDILDAIGTEDVAQTGTSGFTLIGTSANFSEAVAQIVEFYGVEKELTGFKKVIKTDPLTSDELEVVYIFINGQGDYEFAYIICENGSFYYAYNEELERQNSQNFEGIKLSQVVEIFKFDCAQIINTYANTYRIYSYDGKLYYDSNEENDKYVLENNSCYLLQYDFMDSIDRTVASIIIANKTYKAVLVESINNNSGYYAFEKDGNNYYVRLDLGGNLLTSIYSDFDSTSKLKNVYFSYDLVNEVVKLNQGALKLRINFYDYDFDGATITYSYTDKNGNEINEEISNVETLNKISKTYSQDFSLKEDVEYEREYWSGSEYKELYDKIVAKFELQEDSNAKVYLIGGKCVFEIGNDKFYIFFDQGYKLLYKQGDAIDSLYRVDWSTNEIEEVEQSCVTYYQTLASLIAEKYEITSLVSSSVGFNEYGYTMNLNDDTFYVFKYNESLYVQKAGDENIYRFDLHADPAQIVDLDSEPDYEDMTELDRIQANIDFDALAVDVFDLNGKVGVKFAGGDENAVKFLNYLKNTGKDVSIAEIVDNGEYGYVIKLGNETSVYEGYYFLTNIEDGKTVLYYQDKWYKLLENSDRIYGLEKILEDNCVVIARFVDMDLTEEFSASSDDETWLCTLEHQVKFDKFFENGSHSEVEFYIPTEELSAIEMVLSSDKLVHITAQSHEETFTLPASKENKFVYFYSTMKNIEIKYVDEWNSINEATVVSVNGTFGQQISVEEGGKTFYLYAVKLLPVYGTNDYEIYEKIIEY